MHASSTPCGVAIQLQDLNHTFSGNVQAIQNLSLSLAAGEFLAILGPSGCGKSTLLRLMARLDQPTSGNIFSSRPLQNNIACVFQDAHVLPWRSVIQNVMLPLELTGVSKSHRRLKAIAAIEQVGLSDAINRYPAQLSGGMRMRVSLARAMVTDPQLLLLDEPFAALDEITRQRLDEHLRVLWRQSAMTVVFVTHSITEAVFLADRVVVMSPRPGRIIMERKIDLPADRDAMLRSTPEFAEQTRDLYAALAAGGV